MLYRIEGDYPNARAWYSDMSDAEIMENVWGKKVRPVGLFTMWRSRARVSRREAAVETGAGEQEGIGSDYGLL